MMVREVKGSNSHMPSYAMLCSSLLEQTLTNVLYRFAIQLWDEERDALVFAGDPKRNVTLQQAVSML